jgi:biopolymer transport protein ExbD
VALSAQRVRSKARNAVRRREDQIEQDEIESGELNLIPYLDMVTNLMLFLLASISAGIILVQIDTQLPDRAPPSVNAAQPAQTPPDEQPLKLVLLVLPDRIDLGSFTGLEGTLTSPKASFPRTGKEGAACDGDYMCESNKCDSDKAVCVASQDAPQPVYDYRKVNAALFEIANRRYNGKDRKYETYQAILMADTRIPYSTITSVMAAMRCKLPEFGKEPESCMLPTEDPDLQKAADPISPDKKLYDTKRAAYDPNKMALFPDILFSSQITQ